MRLLATVLLLSTSGLLTALARALAATHYVDAGSTNAVPPFTNWANAATTIQDAVDAAVDGDTVLVTNPVFQHALQPCAAFLKRGTIGPGPPAFGNRTETPAILHQLVETGAPPVSLPSLG
jgi:hypothetical protein